MNNIVVFLQQNTDWVFHLSMEHLWLSGLSLLIAIFIAIPTGILITHSKQLALKTIALTNFIMLIPSIALFGLMMPLLTPIGYGIGKLPALIALVLYTLIPIIHNTYTGIKNIDSAYIDSARSLGMNKWQILRSVELPLAMPVIFSGIHIALVMNIGMTAIATYIGAGGLGVLIQQGITRTYPEMIFTGAIIIALLAIFADFMMRILERYLNKSHYLG